MNCMIRVRGKGIGKVDNERIVFWDCILGLYCEIVL